MNHVTLTVLQRMPLVMVFVSTDVQKLLLIHSCFCDVTKPSLPFVSQVCYYYSVPTWHGKPVKCIFLPWMTASWLVCPYITSSFPVFLWFLSSVSCLTSPQSSLLWRHSSRYSAQLLHCVLFSCPRWVNKSAKGNICLSYLKLFVLLPLCNKLMGNKFET